jgi:branched-chain amino acid transport system ATP-binding protein
MIQLCGRPILVTPNSSPLLEITDLEVSYGVVPVLRGVSLSVYAGEVVAVLGANGAGKSTTMRTISGLVSPRAGAIRFDGASITKLAPARILRLGVAHCPEGRRLFGALTVSENLRLGASTRKAVTAVRADTERMLTLFPILAERLHQTSSTLSGGEQQQLALARALMSAPRLLILDEPSLGVAPLLVRHIFKALAELKSQGMSILLVEQNIDLALELADRAYVLRTGKVELSGPVRELRSGMRIADAYLGSAT